MRRTLLALSALILLAGLAPAAAPIIDVFELMREAERWESLPLWPGFQPGTIPAAIFDGEKTYLFLHPSPPEGFSPVSGKERAHVFDGQHPAVQGNSRVRIADVWCATLVPRLASRWTGQPYTMRNQAGHLIHEKFHVFQRHRHPGWRPNDGLLFTYPPDDPKSLALRRLEIESIRRAVVATTRADVAAWVAEALEFRKERLMALDQNRRDYEGELQRFEGVAEYIEYLAGGKEMSIMPVDPGYAPAAIRHLGYLLGRWMSHCLDRLDSDWKRRMEAGEFDYLHEAFADLVSQRRQTRRFGDAEIGQFMESAEKDLIARSKEVESIREEFFAQPGYRLEIVSHEEPMRLVMFFAHMTDALNERELLHERLLTLRHQKGQIRVRDLPCLTESDGATGVVKLTITGLPERPDFDDAARKLSINGSDLNAEFEPVSIKEAGMVITVYLN
jgi:hypothetical protein